MDDPPTAIEIAVEQNLLERCPCMGHLHHFHQLSLGFRAYKLQCMHNASVRLSKEVSDM